MLLCTFAGEGAARCAPITKRSGWRLAHPSSTSSGIESVIAAPSADDSACFHTRRGLGHTGTAVETRLTRITTVRLDPTHERSGMRAFIQQAVTSVERGRSGCRGILLLQLDNLLTQVQERLIQDSASRRNDLDHADLIHDKSAAAAVLRCRELHRGHEPVGDQMIRLCRQLELFVLMAIEAAGNSDRRAGMERTKGRGAGRVLAWVVAAGVLILARKLSHERQRRTARRRFVAMAERNEHYAG